MKWPFFNASAFKKLTHRSIDWCLQRIMVIVYSCLCFVSISRGLMTTSIGFQLVPPLKLLSQLSDFSLFWLVCYLVHSFQYIFVYSFIYYSLIVIIVFFSHELCNFFHVNILLLLLFCCWRFWKISTAHSTACCFKAMFLLSNFHSLCYTVID